MICQIDSLALDIGSANDLLDRLYSIAHWVSKKVWGADRSPDFFHSQDHHMSSGVEDCFLVTKIVSNTALSVTYFSRCIVLHAE